MVRKYGGKIALGLTVTSSSSLLNLLSHYSRIPLPFVSVSSQVACIYNGLLIVKKLDSKDTSAQKAQNQVLFYIKMLTFGSFIGFAAKVLSVFNIGKTLYARPPCEGDGFVHFNHVQLTFLMSLVPIICLPKVRKREKT